MKTAILKRDIEYFGGCIPEGTKVEITQEGENTYMFRIVNQKQPLEYLAVKSAFKIQSQ